MKQRQTRYSVACKDNPKHVLAISIPGLKRAEQLIKDGYFHNVMYKLRADLELIAVAE